MRLVTDGAELEFSCSEDTGRSGFYLRMNFETIRNNLKADAHGDHEVQALLQVSILALGDLQDYVAETSTEPWPNEGPDQIPTPNGEIVDRSILLWFGPRQAPIAECRPIPLDEPWVLDSAE